MSREASGNMEHIFSFQWMDACYDQLPPTQPPLIAENGFTTYSTSSYPTHQPTSYDSPSKLLALDPSYASAPLSYSQDMAYRCSSEWVVNLDTPSYSPSSCINCQYPTDNSPLSSAGMQQNPSNQSSADEFIPDTLPDSKPSSPLSSTSFSEYCPVPGCRSVFTKNKQWRPGNMKRHMKTHQRGSKLQCSRCTRVYKRSDARLVHERKHHPDLHPSQRQRHEGTDPFRDLMGHQRISHDYSEQNVFYEHGDF